MRNSWRNEPEIKDLLRYSRNLFPKPDVLGEGYGIWNGARNKVCFVAHVDSLGESWVGQQKSAFVQSIFRAIKYPDCTEKIPSYGFADDFLGVLGCRIFNYLGYPVVLTDHEEIGGIGAQQICADLDDLGFYPELFIELDRKGTGFVSYWKDTKQREIDEIVQEMGIVKESGSFSDISILCPHFDVPGINVGIGYYLQHTNDEYFVPKDFWHGMNNALQIASVIELDSL